jgi:hypothetical protein
MSALPAPATGSGPLGGVAMHEPDAQLTTLAHARSAMHSDNRWPRTNSGDRLLDGTVLALDAARPPASGERSTATISPFTITREFVSDIPITRDGAPGHQPGSASTNEPREHGIARTPAGPSLPAACGIAAQRLLARYLAIASALALEPDASHGHARAQTASSDPLTPCQIPDSHLGQILFFRQFSRSQLATVRNGLRVLSAPRGTRIDTRSTLWIVLRGAVQTSVRRGASTCRVRVAGPGRCVGQLSLIAASRPKLAPILEAELRERAVLLEIPIERAATLLDELTPAGRRFAHALNQDIASALHDAKDPLAPTSGSCAARPFDLTAALEASLNTGADHAPDEFSACGSPPAAAAPRPGLVAATLPLVTRTEALGQERRQRVRRFGPSSSYDAHAGLA